MKTKTTTIFLTIILLVANRSPIFSQVNDMDKSSLQPTPPVGVDAPSSGN